MNQLVESRAAALLRRLVVLQPGEAPALLGSFATLFFMFASYTILRPVRDALGITSGLEKIPYLFWGVFVVMLVLQPLYGWLTSRYPRAVFLPWVYGFFIANLLGFYVWDKTKKIAELKGLVRGLDKKDAVLPSDNQLQHLFSMISKSQQGFRDLIDSFDDILLAMDLEGEIRAVNRSFADLVGRPFQEIIGCRLGEFFEDVDGNPIEVLETGKARFLERRIWSGVIHVRLKKRNAVYFFDCVAHSMLRDDEVHGVTVLARDITAMKRSEARFTELFETLQEGIYIVTPEDKILEVNPALVRMLGYSSKEELMSKRVSEVFAD